jgi:hypothetical protein
MSSSRFVSSTKPLPATGQSRRRIAQAAGAKLGFIALTDAAPLFVGIEKGFFKKHGMTMSKCSSRASWGTTRDNLVLGSGKGNGIDGAHILTPMPYLISSGAVTANNVQVPMYILARLNLGGQCISVGKEYEELKVGVDTKEFKRALAAKAAGQGGEGRHDLPRRHPRHVDPLLARRRRHRPQQGHQDHRRAAGADGRQHEGGHHGHLLRLRAVEPAAHQPEASATPRSPPASCG